VPIGFDDNFVTLALMIFEVHYWNGYIYGFGNEQFAYRAIRAPLMPALLVLRFASMIVYYRLRVYPNGLE
jgi:hypothetical protein